MTGWAKPVVVLTVLAALIVANILEFRAKRHKDRTWLVGIELEDRLAVSQYRQVQNIEQLLHIVASTLIATLVTLLWT
jgi:hypothetical protein